MATAHALAKSSNSIFSSLNSYWGSFGLKTATLLMPGGVIISGIAQGCLCAQIDQENKEANLGIKEINKKIVSLQDDASLFTAAGCMNIAITGVVLAVLGIPFAPEIVLGMVLLTLVSLFVSLYILNSEYFSTQPPSLQEMGSI